MRELSNVDDLAAEIHEISTDHGFSPPDLNNLPEKLMLSVSELAEAMEEHRGEGRLLHGAADPQGRWKPDGILVEIADSVIRNLHMMHSILEREGMLRQGFTVSGIIVEKVHYNAGRPAMHGKAY